MKKRLRSRVLALGVAGTTLLGSAAILGPGRAWAQDKPVATVSLEQARKNFELKHYSEAKAALDDIDASQLPEDQRGTYNDLKTKVAAALAAAPAGTTALDQAKASIEAKKYAKAVEILNGIINNAAADAELKAQANAQLAVAQAEQKRSAPKMVELLKTAEAAVDAGKLDEAADALATIEDTGAPLGFENEAKPANLRKRIAEKRAAMVAAATGPSVTATTTTVVPATNPLTSVATTEPTPATGPVVVDVGPSATGQGPIVTVPPAAPAPNDLLSQTLEDERIETQRAETAYNLAMEQGRTALNTAKTADDFDNAIRQADEARRVIDQRRRFFPEERYRALSNAALTLRDQADNRKKAWLEQTATVSKLTAEQEELRNIKLRQQDRQQKIALLFRDADTFLQQQQYNEAADTLKQILAIEPFNNAAKLSLRLTQDTIMFRKFEELNQLQGKEFLNQSIISKELLIPYSDLLVYPEDWVEISRYRIAEYQNSLDSPRNRAVRDRLEQTLQGAIKTEPTGELSAVIDRWRTLTGLNVVPNWKQIETVVPKNTQIAIDLRDVTARQALNLILEEASAGLATPLAWTIDEGVIRISTLDEINKRHKITRTYNIRELLLPKNTSFSVPSVSNYQQTQSGGSQGGIGGIGGVGGGVGGGGGGQLFGGGQGGQGGQSGSTSSALSTFDQKAYDEAAKKLMTTVAENVDRESWTTVGDEPWAAAGANAFGTMRNFEGTLIITTTSEDHQKVYDLLARIRELKTIQISIESRLLLVSNNFLDDFGIGWNLNINQGALGGSISSVNVSNGTFTQAQPFATGVPGSLAGTSQGALSSSALSTSATIGTILDNWQLSIFLRATQADKRTSSVSAPRITMFDDDTAQIRFTQDINYVQSFGQQITPGTVNSGSIATNTPQVATISADTSLTVHATVSPDRRYVAMNIQPFTRTIDGFDTITFGAASQAASSGGGQVTTLTAGGNIIQLPRTRSTELTTRVSVPDGGTLLIGGQKLVGEAEIEVGVPVLSKIPGLNRLFTNRSFVRDEQTLLILVRPKIIIQREEEIRRYGVDYDRPSNLPRLEGGAAAVPGAGGTFSSVPVLRR